MARRHRNVHVSRTKFYILVLSALGLERFRAVVVLCRPRLDPSDDHSVERKNSRSPCRCEQQADSPGAGITSHVEDLQDAPVRVSRRNERKAPLVYVGRPGANRGVTLRQIVGVRSQRNETQIWLDDGSRLSDSRSLSAWRALLPPARFPSLHRTAIVNPLHVAGLDKHAGAGFHWQDRVRIIEENWSVSRQHRKELVQRLGI